MKKLISMVMIYSMSTFAAPTVDIAILLDTSGSMQSLISQVRDGLWTTLNNLGEISKNNQKAKLRIALYEYGSGVVPMEANYIQQLTPLTTDHMSVAQKLFATKAQGSEEYVGTVIDYAQSDLDFSENINDFKAIIIAGNETIYQGSVDPFTAASNANLKGIIINSIYAGSQTTVIHTGGYSGGYGGRALGNGNCPLWSHCPNPTPAPTPPSDPQTQVNKEYLEYKKLATESGGLVLNIDHKDSVPHIESPYDEKIISVTEKITETYIPYGKNGQSQYDQMRDLDRSVRHSNDGSYLGWGSYRSGGYGQTQISSWDLVSHYREQSDFDISTIMQSKLPSNLEGKSEKEVLAYIESMHSLRLSLEDEVKELQGMRDKFVKVKLAQLQKTKLSFPDAFLEMITTQLNSAGFELN